MLTEILIILFLVLLNGVFSMVEMAIVSARRSLLKQWSDEGHEGAAVALQLAQDPNEFLSTVQFGITLIGVLAGTYGGATFAADLAVFLAKYESFAPYAEMFSFGIVVIGITYASLVVGELVPKRLALAHAEQIASVSSRPLRFVAALTRPVVNLLSGSTEAILSLFGLQNPPEASVTEEEIKIVLEQGMEAGVVEEAEHDLVARVLRLDDRSVNVHMTPRKDIIWLDTTQPQEEQYDKLVCGHSYFPVCAGSLDEISGIINVKEVLKRLLAKEPFDLNSLIQEALFVPDTMTCLRVLEKFKEGRTQLAVVLDEFGSVQGLVSLNDIMEAVFGEVAIQDSMGVVNEASLVELQNGSFSIDGQFAIDDLFEHLGITMQPDLSSTDYQTVAGFIMTFLGQVPHVGSHFEWANFRFEVVDMDGKRVDRVLVTPLKKPETEKSEDQGEKPTADAE